MKLAECAPCHRPDSGTPFGPNVLAKPRGFVQLSPPLERCWRRTVPVMTGRNLRKLSLVPAVALWLAASGAAAQATEFDDWLAEFRVEAAQAGISPGVLDAALGNVKPIPRVIELDRKQPESTQTFEEYLARRVTADLAREGRRLLDKHRALLEAIGEEYGVQPRFVVALWGAETRYGKYTGGFSVIASLATLAYDGRRSKYFRGELLNALKIIDAGHITADKMTGSWAGAMGQSQFMPSSFLHYAVDYDGDQRRDIWATHADIFASAANYLARAGWHGDQTWGRKAWLPDGFDPTLADLGVVKRLSEWQALGVRRANGGDLPGRDLRASIIMPGGEDGPAYVIYDNYRVILKWNRSNYFAVSIGTLADLIGNR